MASVGDVINAGVAHESSSWETTGNVEYAGPVYAYGGRVRFTWHRGMSLYTMSLEFYQYTGTGSIVLINTYDVPSSSGTEHFYSQGAVRAPEFFWERVSGWGQAVCRAWSFGWGMNHAKIFWHRPHTGTANLSGRSLWKSNKGLSITPARAINLCSGV